MRIIHEGRALACKQISDSRDPNFKRVDWVRFDAIIEDALANFADARKRTGSDVHPRNNKPATGQTVKLDMLFEMQDDELMGGYWLSCTIVRVSVTTVRWREG
jgi:hypothetical protein